MRITVSFHGQARTVAGTGEMRLELPEGASVREAVEQVVAQHEALRALVLSSSGAIRQSVLVPVNDAVVDNDATGTLADGDELAIMPAMAGG